MCLYLFKVFLYIFIRHGKANVSDRRQIPCIQIPLPVKWYITALHNQVLLVFDDRLYDLTDNGPQVIGQGAVVFHRQTGIPTPDQSHLQMIYGEVWIFVFFQKTLGQLRLSRVGGPGDEDDHLLLLSVMTPLNKAPARHRTSIRPDINAVSDFNTFYKCEFIHVKMLCNIILCRKGQFCQYTPILGLKDLKNLLEHFHPACNRLFCVPITEPGNQLSYKVILYLSKLIE